jgi:DNA-binding MarR family transcriptional regulator
VNRAEQAGQVRRELSTTSRRVVYVGLTEKGDEQLDVVVAQLALHRKRLVSILSRLD